MILEIGVVDDPERVGFYSGIIESVFALMSFITSECILSYKLYCTTSNMLWQ